MLVLRRCLTSSTLDFGFVVLRRHGPVAAFPASSSTGRPSSQRLWTSSNSNNKVLPTTAEGTLQPTSAQQAKENIKTASYASVIMFGVGVTAVVLYNLYEELLSGNSPNGLFSSASSKCIAHPKIQDLLGEPIKAFGEETRRRRRRHVSYINYIDEAGRKGLRVQFYLQGTRRRATCQVDARQNESGHMQTRFIIATTDDLVQTSVVVEDNR